MKYRRGDIVVVNLGENIGSEQSGIRPCLILSNDKANEVSPTVQIAPLTSRTKNALPVHIKAGVECGLKCQSTVLLEQIRVIDTSRILGFVGHKTLTFLDNIKIFIEFGCANLIDNDKAAIARKEY